MTQLNKYGLYNIGNEQSFEKKTDIIDEYIKFFEDCNSFNEVRDYISSSFGSFEGDKWIEYPDLNKKLYILVQEDRLEFCALKNDIQYYGKGWIIRKEEE